MERDALCTFVTDVLSWNGTHHGVCFLECQPGAQACEIVIGRSGAMCRSFRDETSVTKLQISRRSAKVSRVVYYDTRRTVRSGAAIVVLTCLCARLAFSPELMFINYVSQQDVSGKVEERVALYDFATDDVLPDAMSAEIYARRSSVGLQELQGLLRGCRGSLGAL